MNKGTNSTIPIRAPWRLVAATYAAALPLALIAGIGLWQAGLRLHTTGVSSTLPVSLTIPVPSEARTAGSGAAGVRAGAASVTFALVGSAQQALALRQQEHRWPGSLPPNAELLTVGSDTTAAAVLTAFGFENERRVLQGLPPIVIQDRR